MIVSHQWLQKFFDTPLPEAEELDRALTFHSSEIEEREGDRMDIKVLPDRAGYMLSHRGVALEVAAALNIPLAHDPLKTAPTVFPETTELTVQVCDDTLVPRYMGALVRGVKVGPSPAWLKEAIESVGQRSINNVVDATNYVMLNVGQPLHAFDAGKLTEKDGTRAINVRKAYEGEKISTLTGEEYNLPEGTLLITDAHTDGGLGIAGIKGGKIAEVNESTIDLVIESANFEGAQVRRAAQALKLFTDASLRFQNRPSPELAAYGMRDVLALVTEVAGGEVIGVVDVYTGKQEAAPVTVTLDRINGRLGTSYSAAETSSALNRLELPHTESNGIFTITPPFYRRDVVTPEDVAEEVGRTLGYEQVPSTPLPELPLPAESRYYALERIKDILRERGYVELSTQSFHEAGEIELANPLQTDRPYLRANLSDNMRDALVRAKREAPRTLGPETYLKLFELGTVFTKAGEMQSLALGYEALEGKASKAMLDEDLDALREVMPGLKTPTHDGTVAEVTIPADLTLSTPPAKIALGPFRPYSIYPFALRDIAVWTPEGTEETEVSTLIQKEAGDILLRMDLFDRFEKDGRTSFAFRLVFEAPDRTLADTDLDPVMERMTAALNAKEGFSVR